ncbi:hypothetical protein [Parasitella parasitica]|uniref:GST N-terminal domain-containing protein n=1 Tax=Parasitella parasitica TaxID=35722 RepID=A0A0B7N5B7_9FUNG|nr:hypothetical protein [Parasitella parasitica]
MMDKITLYYFNVGKKHTIACDKNVKLMLADAGLDHEYVCVEGTEWPDLKEKLKHEETHSCTLPYIITSSQRLFKTVAIMRYISTKLGGKYHGSSPEDQILDAVTELNDMWFE